MALASRVAKHLQEWHAHYCFVDSGRGEAVWSRLFQMGYQDRVIPVHFAGTTYSDLYHRKKDEIWGRMKSHLCHPEFPASLPDDPDLIRDLSAPTYEINERGKMQMEGKKSLAKRGFRSLDRGDSLALTYSEELDETPILTDDMRRLGVTEEILNHVIRQDNGTDEKDYDPLTYMDKYMQSDESFI